MAQKTSKSIFSFILLSFCLFVIGNNATAQNRNTISADQVSSSSTDASPSHGLLILGAGAAPYYMGTDKYTPIPFIAGSYRKGSTRYTSRGLGVDINLNAGHRLAYGPILHWRPKQKRSHARGRAKELDDIKGSAELGGFVGYRLGGNQYGQGRLNLRLSGMQGIDNTHEGLVLIGRADYAVLRTRPLSIDVSLKTSWASSDYQRTYYGVTDSEADHSGLDVYRPGSGFRNVTAGLTLNHQISSSFGILGHASVTRLVGRTADSPIVHEASKTTALVGVAATWHF